MRNDGSDILGSLHQRMAAPPTRRRGITQLLSITPPALGANLVRSVPGDYWERLLSISFTLTTSATAGQRSLFLNYATGDGTIWNSTAIAEGVGSSVVTNQYGDLAYTSASQTLQSAEAEGSLTSPTAFTNIAASPTLPPGEYVVYVVINMSGTLAAGTDNNNVRLTVGGTAFETFDNNIGPAPQPFGPINVNLATTGTIIVQTGGNAGTTGAVYSATLNIQAAVQQNEFTIPDLTFEPGWQMQITVGNIQAGDQLSGINMLLERYSSNFANGGMRDEEERWARAELREAIRGSWG